MIINIKIPPYSLLGTPHYYLSKKDVFWEPRYAIKEQQQQQFKAMVLGLPMLMGIPGGSV